MLTNEGTVITAQEINHILERIEIKQHELTITLANSRSPNSGRGKSKAKPEVLSVPWTKRPSTAGKGLLHAPPAEESRLSPETRGALLKAIASARQWIADIESSAVENFSEIAKREGKLERHIRLLAPLAFTSPNLIRSIVDGSADPEITVTGLAKALGDRWSDRSDHTGMAAVLAPQR